MSFLHLHPKFTATCKREGAIAIAGGLEIQADVTIATLEVGVEDITSEVIRTPDGQDVGLALRLWVDDVATVWRQGDRWTLTYRGETHELEAVAIKGPFGTGVWDCAQIEVRSPARVGV